MGNKFQRFLWTVAGAELDILEKCRTDHKKFSAIGATILMTAFIAFLREHLQRGILHRAATNLPEV